MDSDIILIWFFAKGATAHCLRISMRAAGFKCSFKHIYAITQIMLDLVISAGIVWQRVQNRPARMPSCRAHFAQAYYFLS